MSYRPAPEPPVRRSQRYLVSPSRLAAIKMQRSTSLQLHNRLVYRTRNLPCSLPLTLAHSTQESRLEGDHLVPESLLQLDCIVSAPFAENTFIAHLAGSSQCLIIDPGFDPEAVIEKITEKKLSPVAILNTHGHSDHIAGNAAMKARWPDCPLIIGAGDAPKLTDANLNLSAPFGIELISPPADQTVREGDRLELGGISLEVFDTPGHSCGHVVFLYRGQEPWIVFGGDVLFRGSVGRTDFPDGDMRALTLSIRKKLFTLPNETIVLPGHGEATTVGYERQSNPFVGDGGLDR